MLVFTEQSLMRGDPISVRCRFDGRWVSGFVVAELVEDATGIRVRVRRRSDSAVLPATFAASDVVRQT